MSRVTAPSQTGSFGQRIGDDFAEPDARSTQIVLLESLQITFGFSGGPVLRSGSNFTSDDRELVGIVQGGDPKNGKISWCIPSDSIAKFLNSPNDIWERYPPKQWKAQMFKNAAFRRTDEKMLVGFPLVFKTPQDTISEQWNQRMETEVKISENGRLDAVTKTWATRMLGFNGEVIVYLCDAAGNVLWRTEHRHVWGLSLLNMDRKETWSEQIPEKVLARVSKCLIHHQDSPKGLDEALGLATVRFGDSEIRILKNLANAIDIPWKLEEKK